MKIYSQNVVGYFELLMKYLGFWLNQTFELSCIYDENEEPVYNEIYTGK